MIDKSNNQELCVRAPKQFDSPEHFESHPYPQHTVPAADGLDQCTNPSVSQAFNAGAANLVDEHSQMR